MRARWLGLAAGAALILGAACSNGGTQRAQSSPKRSQPASALQEVAPQRLSAGQCALVLWTKAQPPLRVLVAFSDPSVARVKVGGKTIDLPQTNRGGEVAFGHAPRQRFEGENMAIAFNLEFETRRGLVGGVIAPSGTLEVQTRQGWSAITPVAGIVACQP